MLLSPDHLSPGSAIAEPPTAGCGIVPDSPRDPMQFTAPVVRASDEEEDVDEDEEVDDIGEVAPAEQIDDFDEDDFDDDFDDDFEEESEEDELAADLNEDSDGSDEDEEDLDEDEFDDA
jgi:hypothetical protein